MDKNTLSYWFPKIKAAGLPVPETIILQMSEAAWDGVRNGIDGENVTDAELTACSLFFAEIDSAAQRIGYPVFLRTGHTSGKHSWENTCYLKSEADIPRHVAEIALYSEMAGIIGLPWREWTVREMLPVKPYGMCPRYGNMPVVKEFRFFVDDGIIRCWHPYWPKDALDDGGATDIDYAMLCYMTNEPELRALAEAAGRAAPGRWSIDLLETERGWYITDMAESKLSYHDESCPHRQDQRRFRLEDWRADEVIKDV